MLTLSKMTNFMVFRTERFCNDNFIFVENGRKFSKTVENMWEKEKLLVMSNFFLSHSVFKRLVLQTRKNQDLFGKGLKVFRPIYLENTGSCRSNSLGPLSTSIILFSPECRSPGS